MIETLNLIASMIVITSLVMIFMSKTITTRARMMRDIVMPAELLKRSLMARDGVYLALGGASLHLIAKVAENNPLMASLYVALIGLLMWVLNAWNDRIAKLQRMIF